MSYAVSADLEDFLGPKVLAQLSSDTVTADATLMQRVIDSAGNMIDGYLGGRYTVPITDAAALSILKPHCLIIAKYLLLERRMAAGYDDGGEKLFDQTMAWLKRVAEGKASLTGASDKAGQAVSEAEVYTIGSNEVVFVDPQETGGMI